MTVFLEHLLPGTFFVLFGVWLTIQTWMHYFYSLTKRGKAYRSQISYSTDCRRCNVDLMAVLLCVAGVLGMVTQLTHIFHPASYHGGSLDVTTAQHVTMYFFFGLAGVLKLFHPVLKRLIPQIDNIEYIALIMVFSIQAILFKFHLMGRDILDTMLHTYLLYSAYGCIIMTITEMIFRGQVLLSLGRAYFILLQGTWLLQLAFVLDNPIAGHGEWDPHDHDDLMLTTCMFTWHIGGVFLFSFSCGLGWACVYRRKGKIQDEQLTLKPNTSGYVHLINNEEDVENATDLEI